MKIPYELLHGTPPDYSLLRVFGCSCFPWQKPLTEHKLLPRAPPCIFIGYSDTSKGYRCYNTLTGKVITSRHVVFDELTFPSLLPTSPTTDSTTSHQLLTPISSLSPINTHHNSHPPPSSHAPIVPALPHSIPTSSHHTPDTPNSYSTIGQIHTPTCPETLQLTPPPLPQPSTPSASLLPAPPPNHPMVTRLKAGITKPKHIFSLITPTSSTFDPRTYAQAIKQPHWCEAMTEGFAALQHQSTWQLVPRPPNQNIIGCR